MLGLGVVVLVEATRLVRGGAPPLPALARAGGAVLLVAAAVLVFSGTLATAAGRYPGSSGDTRVRRLGSFQPSVALHVRAVAAFGIVFLVLAAWAWRNRERFPWLVRALRRAARDPRRADGDRRDPVPHLPATCRGGSCSCT